MKLKAKKMLSILLAAAMMSTLFVALPITASAEDEPVPVDSKNEFKIYSGSENDYRIREWDDFATSKTYEISVAGIDKDEHFIIDASSLNNPFSEDATFTWGENGTGGVGVEINGNLKTENSIELTVTAAELTKSNGNIQIKLVFSNGTTDTTYRFRFQSTVGIKLRATGNSAENIICVEDCTDITNGTLSTPQDWNNTAPNSAKAYGVTIPSVTISANANGLDNTYNKISIRISVKCGSRYAVTLFKVNGVPTLFDDEEETFTGFLSYFIGEHDGEIDEDDDTLISKLYTIEIVFSELPYAKLTGPEGKTAIETKVAKFPSEFESIFEEYEADDGNNIHYRYPDLGKEGESIIISTIRKLDGFVPLAWELIPDVDYSNAVLGITVTKVVNGNSVSAKGSAYILAWDDWNKFTYEAVQGGFLGAYEGGSVAKIKNTSTTTFYATESGVYTVKFSAYELEDPISENKIPDDAALIKEASVTITVTDNTPPPPPPSSGGGAITFTVTFDSNGGSAVAKATVNSGEKAAKPANPTKEGFKFMEWYSDADLTTAYDFNAVVTKNITLYAMWEEGEEEEEGDDGVGDTGLPFKDISASAWYLEDVQFVYERGLMKGTSDDAFDPNATLTRAMVVTILYRYEGSPDVSELENPFGDVAEGQWYTEAIKWAADNEIVKGIAEGKFAPNALVSRQDFAVILLRYMNYLEVNLAVTLDFVIYADASEIASYAAEAIQTLNKLGIINGIGENADGQSIIDPKGNATRAQAAALIHRFILLIEGLEEEE